jgi:hypothetical protein
VSELVICPAHSAARVALTNRRDALVETLLSSARSTPDRMAAFRTDGVPTGRIPTARGVVGLSFVVSAALTDADIDPTMEVIGRACVVHRTVLDAG